MKLNLLHYPLAKEFFISLIPNVSKVIPDPAAESGI